MKRRGALAVLSGVVLMSAVVSAGGQEGSVATSGNDFHSFCSSCHGAAGKGDGAIAGSLKKRPADLTRLATNNGGIFPGDAVQKSITAGHAGTDMPAWKEIFSKSKGSPDSEAVQRRIENLVKYVETLQIK